MIIYSIQHLPKKTVFTKTEFITVCDMLHIDGGEMLSIKQIYNCSEERRRPMMKQIFCGKH